jgi:hypothetical protein
MYFLEAEKYLSNKSPIDDRQRETMKCLAGYRGSEEQDLRRALSLLKPSSSSLFIDIGSGEGQVLLYVAREAKCHCIGLENDAALVSISNKAIASASDTVSSLISISEVDAETFNYHEICSQYNDVVIYLFLSHFGYSVMGSILLERCPVNTRVVTVSNPIDHPFWTPKCVWLGDNSTAMGAMTLYLYVIDEQTKLAFTQEKKKDNQKSTSILKKKKTELVQWLHPPPGSYLPRSVPTNTTSFPCTTSVLDIHAFLQLQGEEASTAAAPLSTSTPIRTTDLSFSKNINNNNKVNRELPMPHKRAITSCMVPPPLAPPLPPPLPPI